MKTSNEVHEQLISAFQSAQLPSQSQIIDEMYADFQEQQEAARAYFADHKWDELPEDGFEQQWYSFSYLIPEAYRYYLPALLIGALTNWSKSDSLLYSTISHLTPDLIAVHYDGIDEYFERRVSSLTSEQFAAVGAYLALFLKEKPDWLTFRAARAFRWGWNRVDSEASQAFRVFYDQMHQWSYPEPPAEARSLVEEIHAAFDTTPYPGDVALCDSESGDDEPMESALDFRGTGWRRLHPAQLAANYTSLSFLSAAGFRYYLPAYLLASLYKADRNSNADVASHLTSYLTGQSQPSEYKRVKSLVDCGIESGLMNSQNGEEMLTMLRESPPGPSDQEMHQYSVQRMSLFARTERQAIIHYLQHVGEPDNYYAGDIHAALNSYWLPSLAGS